MTGYLAAVAALELGASLPSMAGGADTSSATVRPRRITSYERWRSAPDTPSDWDARDKDTHVPDEPIGHRDVDVDESAARSRAPSKLLEDQPRDAHPLRRVAADRAVAEDAPVRPAPAAVTPTVRTERAPSRSNNAPNVGDGLPHVLPAGPEPTGERGARSRVVRPEQRPDAPSVTEPAPRRTSAIVDPIRRLRDPISITPRHADDREVPRAQSRERSDEQAPPVVVTIGRIEVRAVSAPVVSRPQRSAPAAMSLEDYLSQRARGLR